ncbi:ketopantoate reductase PanE/ApbA-domain-containing protein [Jimgerdemannia flammicorona]|uniref:Ketopantoate reductase PanE/ApbA-domain-containing protein n=1 Tax=Jimgerdemannia flammicorona TaxID=994334 RepID=A0A433QTJ5_9FUNG|nr:ketopantoate reductase PanE/ApbA-domain-containing protein [Jimgerdemannia flammicorona]
MKIAVFGAGNIGCFFGAQLLHTGAHEVLFVGRQRVQNLIRNAGALTVVPVNRPTISIPADKVSFVTDLQDLIAFDPDYVLVTLKGPQVQAAFKELGDLRFDEKTVFISIQNGARNPDLIRTLVPGNLVLGGMVPFNVTISPEDGSRFCQGSGGTLYIEQSAKTEPMALALREAGIVIQVSGNITGVLYGKIATNLNNAINALSGIGLLAELSQRSYRHIWSRCITEALSVYFAAGIVSLPVWGFPTEFMPYMLSLPDFVCVLLFRNVIGIKPGAGSSMADDFVNGKPTEIGDLNGEIVRLADEIGKGDDVPYCRGVLWLVQEVERRQRSGWGGAGWRPKLTGEQIRVFCTAGASNTVAPAAVDILVTAILVVT